ncbi:MAG: stalk domain-containing protein, partial [Syntrophomonas sp.]
MSRSFFIKVVSVVVVLILAGSICFTSSSYAVQTISIVINGKEVTSDVSPEVKDNRVLVPIRVISEGLGAQVIWDEDNNQVIVNSNAVTGNMGSQPSVSAGNDISIVIDGQIVDSDVPPTVKDYRVLVPIRVISENLGAQVIWDGDNNQVVITKEIPDNDTNISILGEPVATSAQLKTLLTANNPDAPDLVDLYLSIGREYGIRGDIAFCQAAKETGWWRFTGLVQPVQNNYCGLWATGTPNTGEEDLHDADSTRVWFVKGSYGAYFDSPATGVEAQIQHL